MISDCRNVVMTMTEKNEQKLIFGLAENIIFNE
jgi:hypothetical protein